MEWPMARLEAPMMTRRGMVAGAAVPALSYTRILGANERIGLGVIGLGERGTSVMGLFQKNDDVEVRALCDVYGLRVDQGRQKSAPTGSCWNWPQSTPSSSPLPITGTRTTPSMP